MVESEASVKESWRRRTLDEITAKIPSYSKAGLIALSAVIISYVFVSFLLLSIVQQKVTENLADTNISFTDAYYLQDRKTEIDETLSTTRKSFEDARRALADSEKKINRSEQRQADLSRDFRDQISNQNLGANCPSQFGSESNNLVTSDNFYQRLAACRRTSPAGTNIDPGSIPQLLNEIRTVERELQDLRFDQRALEDSLTRKEEAFQKASTDAASAEAIDPAFQPQRKMETSWIYFDVFTSFPPVVIPLFLVFSSGLFGAILIRLILIVYPDNSYQLANQTHLLQHVILGGLIASALYVIMSAGTAVLGFSSGGSDTAENLFSFGAIGLFSGMFSNRAANWISHQANFLDGRNTTIETYD